MIGRLRHEQDRYRDLAKSGQSPQTRVQLRQVNNQLVGRVDTRFGFCRPGFGAAPQPLNLSVYPVFQRLLVLLLRQQKLFFLFQKRAVVSRDAQKPVRISAAQLHRLRSHVFQKVAIMAHHHAGKRFRAQKLFQPFNTFKVKMVRGFVQQEHVRLLHQRFCNRQPLAPTAGKPCCFGIKVFKAGTSQRFKQASWAFRLRHCAALQRFCHHRPHRLTRGKLRFLDHIAEPGVPAHRNIAAIRFNAAGKNPQQRGFAGAIRPDQANAVPFRNGERYVLKKRRSTVGFGDPLCVDDGRQRFTRLPWAYVFFTNFNDALFMQ